MVNGLAGLNVIVPVEELDKLTLIATPVTGFPNESCRCSVILVEGIPAVTFTGTLVNASLFTPAALTVILLCVPLMLAVTVSVAVIDCVPAVLSVTALENVCVPLSAPTKV